MKRFSLSEADTLLGKAAADGLQALGWILAEASQADAELRVEILEDLAHPSVGKGAWDCAVLVVQAPDRIGLSELSLHLQKLAVEAAPEVRVNGVAVAEGWEKDLAASIDWLAGAAMVTGQLILLSSEPAPSIPL